MLIKPGEATRVKLWECGDRVPTHGHVNNEVVVNQKGKQIRELPWTRGVSQISG